MEKQRKVTRTATGYELTDADRLKVGRLYTLWYVDRDALAAKYGVSKYTIKLWARQWEEAQRCGA